jgi:hypothetical protein
MELHIKQKIDTINLNIIIFEDLSIITEKKNYEMIELYPKLQKIFKILNIPEDKFKMRDKRVSSKVLINYNGIFLEFKSVPPRPGQQINHSKKNLNIQLKGEYFLENDFTQFLEIYEQLEVDSISKIELCFDYIQEKDFLKETMNVFLNNKEKITKLKGENKIIFNMDYENEQSIHYFNKSKCLKIYNKALELKNNKKRPLFYNKNPEFLNKNHYRIEISISKSAIIETNIKLKDLLLKKVNEDEIIKICKDYFFKDFEIKKQSKIKSIISALKKQS